jgi:autotransporter-associated beta strand protein
MAFAQFTATHSSVKNSLRLHHAGDLIRRRKDIALRSLLRDCVRLGVSLLALSVAMAASAARAGCVENTSGGSSVTCSGTTRFSESEYAGFRASGTPITSLTVAPNATIDSDGTAISLGDNAQITIGVGATVKSNSQGKGPNEIGANTIEVGSRSTIDIFGTVLSQGLGAKNDRGGDEAINPLGNGNTITIHQGGRIETLEDGTPAIWFEAKRDNGLINTVLNNGTIRAGASGTSPIIGNGGAVVVKFENGPTGVVEGDLTLGGGEDMVVLRGGSRFVGSIATGGGNDNVDMYKGAEFTGSVDGGDGSNTLSLQGDAGDAGSAALIPGSVSNFNAINKAGTSTWTISGSVSQLGSSGVAINVNQGTLVLSGDNNGYQGATTVAAAGTLQIGEGGGQGSLPGAITNNGVLTFNRTGRLVVSGAIAGTGSVRQIGAGEVTLAGALSGVSLRVEAGRLALAGSSTLTTAGAPAVPGGFATAAYVAGGTLDNAGTITATQTANQDGVRIDGATLINSGTITASGRGVFVPAGATLVNTGSITGLTGVFFGNGAANGGLSITGNGSITGTSGDGISALNVAGNVTLGTSANPLGAVTGSGGSALTIVVNGANAVGIVTGGPLTGGDGRGISTSTVDGATGIVQAAGTIRATGDGIKAGSSGIGAISIDTSGGQIGTSANPVGSDGIIATRAGAGSITVTSGVINATGVGASLQTTSTGAGDVALTAKGSITSANGGAIVAQSAGTGNVTITTGGGTTLTAGGRAAVLAAGIGTGAGSVQVGNNATVTRAGAGSGDFGLDVRNNDDGSSAGPTPSPGAALNGALTAIAVTNAGTITNSFAVAGIRARANSDGVVRVTNSGAIGGGASGIVALNAGAGGVTVANTGLISGAATNGITAQATGAAGGVSVSNTNAIGAAGAAVSGAGVTALIGNAGNAATLSIDGGGAIDAAGTGIDARTLGSGAVTLGGATPLGAITSGGVGINAVIGSAASTAGLGVTSAGRIIAGTTGINAVTTGNGTVTISAGPVTTTNGSGLVATGRAGPVAVTANDAITAGGAGAAGIFLTGSGVGNTVTVGASGSVSGAIGLRLAGGGTTVLNNGGSIAASAAGGNAIQIDAGRLALGPNTGTLTGNLAIAGTAGALAVNRATNLTLANTITGTGTLDQNGAGLLALTGANSAGSGQFTGTANVNAGILAINGTFGDTAGRSALVNVNSGGTLHGSGTIAGSVTVAAGATVSAGNSPGTLTVAGDYRLASGATSLFELGMPDIVGGPTNDLIEVGGDLTLAGTLRLVNAADTAASPVAGTYRLFNYGGTLSGRFDAVTSPTPILATVYTTIPNQVNLFLVNAGQVAQYWDGTDTTGAGAGGQGGTAVWNGANTNWTGSPTSAVNAAWASGVGIFAGTAGTVTVAGAQNVQGLQFVTDGYRLAGAGTLNLAGDPFSTPNQSFVTVDGGVGATIANALTDAGGTIGLNKLGAGTLTLAGVNTYAGATSVTAGTLVLAAGGSLTSDVSVAGGGTFANAGNLAAGLTNAGTTTNAGTIAGTVTNSGRFANTGTVAGRVTNTAGTLTNTGTLDGGATVTGGTLALDAGSLVNGALANSATVTAQGRINGTLTNAASAVFTNTGTLNGDIGNAGTASNAAAILGAVTNTGRFTNSGSVGGLLTQSAGTSANTGTLSAGATVTGGALALDAGSLVTGALANSATVTAQGRINGAVINGPGATFTLTGALTGITGVSNNGTLALGGNGLGVGTLGGNGTVRNVSTTAATLTVGTGAGGDSTYGGLLQDGAGGGALGLTKAGSGTLTLTGANTYTGATTIAAGTGLRLGDGGALGSIEGTAGVAADGRLTFNRSDAIAFAPAISGSGIVDQNGSGSVTLTGASTAFTGTANVNAGTLGINGTFGDTAGNTAVVSVNNGGTLQGAGTIAGAVFVNNGGTVSTAVAPGQPPGTLTVGGNYTVNAGSNHIFRLGTPNVVGGATNDLIDVGGTLAINGGTATLQNANASGLYRLYNVGGTVTSAGAANAGFAAVTTANGTASIYTVAPGAGGPSQVNARVSLGGQIVQYWDGTDISGLAGGTPGAQGGSGVWNATNANWTDDPAGGQVNQNWLGRFGVFTAPRAGGASTVTVLGQQNLQGLQFAGDGYTLTPGGAGSLNLTGDPNGTAGFSTLRVDRAVTATIAAPITGLGLNKAVGSGTLVLTGTNSFSALTIADGTVDVRGGAAILDSAPVTLADGAGARLLVTNSETIGALAGGGTSGGTVEILAGQTLTTGGNNGSTTFGGSVGGAGGLIKSGAGRFTLTGNNRFTGGTTVADGTLINDGALASGVGVRSGAFFTNNGALAADLTSAGTSANTGTVAGRVTNTAGTLTNTGTLSGGVGVTGGTLALDAGSLVNGALANSATVTARGRINGTVSNAAGARFTLTGPLTGITGFANEGTLSLAGNDLALGTLTGIGAGAVVQNASGRDATLTIGSGDASGTYAGILQDGAGGGRLLLAKTGAGTLTLTGASTHTGATGVTAGTLVLAAGGSLGSDVSVAGGAAFANAGNLAAGLTNAGTATNTGTIAGTVTNSGRFANGGRLASTLTNSRTADNTGTIAGLVANTGTFTTSGTLAGGLTNTGTLTASAGRLDGAIANEAGTLAITGTVAGNGPLSNASGATLRIDRTGRFRNAGLFANAGTATNAGTLDADVTNAAGARFTNAGTVSTASQPFLNAGTLVSTGVLNGGLANTGTAQMSGELNGVLSNAGSLTLTGTTSGITAFTNDGTVDLGGTALSVGSLSGTRASAVLRNGRLTVGADNSSTNYAGTIADGAGATSLTKAGSGTLTLSGVSTYTGATLVSEGTLNLRGTLASAVTVADGARLIGSGSTRTLTVLGGASASPDGAGTLGTVSVTGTVLFAAGSQYRVDVTASGESDRIAATGSATLQGGTVQVTAGTGPYAPRTRYTILSAAGGVTGQFAGVTSNFAFLTPSLTYDANTAFLTLARNDLQFGTVAATRNQGNVAAAAQAQGVGTRLYDGIAVLSAPQARQAFDALSGEIHSSAVTSQFDTGFLVREAILDRLRFGDAPSFGGIGAQGIGQRFAPGTTLPAVYTADLPGRSTVPVPVSTQLVVPNPVALWGQGFGAFGSTGGDGNAARLDQQTSGFLLGADTRLGERWRVGVAGGYTFNTLDLTARQSTATVESGYGALYAGAGFGPVQVRLGGSYAGSSLATNRAVIVPGFSDNASARYGGSLGQAFGEVGYRFGSGIGHVEPFIGAAAIRVGRDGFSERGGAAALTTQGQDYDVATSTVGVQAQGQIGALFGLTTPIFVRGLVGYRRAYGDVLPSTLFSFGVAGQTFLTAGVPVARDAVVAQAGLDWQVASETTLSLAYTGQIGADRTQIHGLKGGFLYRW